MDWLADVVTRLSSAERFSYRTDGEAATEPTALAVVALLAHDRADAAAPHVDWLLERQAANGRFGIDDQQSDPGWATAWSALALNAAARTGIGNARQRVAVKRAIDWLVGVEGSIAERVDGRNEDPSVKGWPWVEGTHAWVEPTAMSLLALEHTGHAQHPRAVSAVRLLHNRLLEDGGCNYGNTIVLGQTLRPHLQPTGVCLLALAGSDDFTGRVAKAIDYLARELSSHTTTESLAYGLMGLAAQNQWPSQGIDWLASGYRRTLERGAAPYKLALLALAALGASCPLIPPATPLMQQARR